MESITTKLNHNPFHGGSIEVKQIGISKKQFDNAKIKYKEYVRDDYHSNEFYEIWVHPQTREAVLVKLKKSNV